MSFKLTPIDALPPAVREKDQAVATLLRDFEASGSPHSQVEEFGELVGDDPVLHGWLKGAVARVAKKLDLPVAAVIRDGGFYLVRREGA